MVNTTFLMYFDNYLVNGGNMLAFDLLVKSL